MNKPNVIDNPLAPEIFATDALWFSLTENNSITQVTFISPRQDPTNGETNYVVNLRLAMSTGGAQRMVAALYDFLTNRGLDPVPKPDDSRVQ